MILKSDSIMLATEEISFDLNGGGVPNLVKKDKFLLTHLLTFHHSSYKITESN